MNHPTVEALKRDFSWENPPMALTNQTISVILIWQISEEGEE